MIRSEPILKNLCEVEDLTEHPCEIFNLRTCLESLSLVPLSSGPDAMEQDWSWASIPTYHAEHPVAHRMLETHLRILGESWKRIRFSRRDRSVQSCWKYLPREPVNS